MTELRLDRVSFHLNDRAVLDGVSLHIPTGSLVALVGANGAGKSSLARIAAGLAAPTSGVANIGAAIAHAMPSLARARACAYLPQARPLAWPMAVRDVVALGRFAYGVHLDRLAARDAAAVSRALDACDLNALADRAADSLSGGETARMHVARALASEAPILIADEPTAALDPLHAWRVMDVIARFTQAGGAALVILHDLALAARFATRIAVLKHGCIIADGPPQAALTTTILKDTFDMDAFMAFEADGPSLRVKGPLI